MDEPKRGPSLKTRLSIDRKGVTAADGVEYFKKKVRPSVCVHVEISGSLQGMEGQSRLRHLESQVRYRPAEVAKLLAGPSTGGNLARIR